MAKIVALPNGYLLQKQFLIIGRRFLTFPPSAAGAARIIFALAPPGRR
jgi:hypothetical protein